MTQPIDRDYNETFTKLGRIMQWNMSYDPQTMFNMNCGNVAAIPPEIIIDVVLAGGLDAWAAEQRCESQKQLKDVLSFIANTAIICPIFRDKNLRDVFPPISNFFTYVNNLQKAGKLNKEMESIADEVFNGTIAQRNLKDNCDKMFHAEHDEDTWEYASAALKRIWHLSDTDIDALRYFVCQAKTLGKQNPSLNKSLYIWGEKKKTGKTTFARALAAALNGDTFDNAGKYESNYATEQQYNDHDLPRACLFNCVILDEAMPRDTKKSYGALKTLITSNSVNYNPKFRHVITIPARRNYIFTSNDDIAEYVQDENERRFYAIRFVLEPLPLDFNQIYDVVKTFVQQCQPREDLSTQAWYDSFASVDGIIRVEIDKVKQEFILQRDYLFEGSSATAWNVAKRFFKNEPDKEQRKIVERAMDEMFGDLVYKSNGSMYKCGFIRDRLNNIEMKQAYIDNEEPTSAPF